MRSIDTSELELLKGKKVIVMFSTTWCGECTMNKPIIAKVEKSYPEIEIVEIDVDKNELWTDDGNLDYAITESPTWIGFSENNEVFRLTNFQNEKQLIELFEKLK